MTSFSGWSVQSAASLAFSLCRQLGLCYSRERREGGSNPQTRRQRERWGSRGGWAAEQERRSRKKERVGGTGYFFFFLIPSRTVAMTWPARGQRKINFFLASFSSDSKQNQDRTPSSFPFLGHPWSRLRTLHLCLCQVAFPSCLSEKLSIIAPSLHPSPLLFASPLLQPTAEKYVAKILPRPLYTTCKMAIQLLVNIVSHTFLDSLTCIVFKDFHKEAHFTDAETEAKDTGRWQSWALNSGSLNPGLKPLIITILVVKLAFKQVSM